MPVGLQLQVLEGEHLPLTMNREMAGGNTVRAGIEFDALGRRVAYHLAVGHGSILSANQERLMPALPIVQGRLSRRLARWLPG